MKLKGWAVESRIYAEDPYRNFLPSIGRLVRYRPPAEANDGIITVRNDTGVTEGGEISLYYDPMIAKLVTHGPTRAEAIAAQADALDAFTLDGIRHNIPFLAALMSHDRWKAGQLSTGFIAEEFPGGFHRAAPQGEVARTLAAVAACVDHVLGERKRRISGQAAGRAVTRERHRVVRLGEQEIALDIARATSAPPIGMLPETAAPAGMESDAFSVRFLDDAAGQDRLLVSDWKAGDPLWSGTMDGRPVAVQVRTALNGFDLSHRGIETRAFVYTEREAQAARLMPAKKVVDSGKALRCPMPGLVVSIAVVEGQDVKAGETLAVVEAMKMENVLRAERDGVVKSIKAKPGDSLSVDQIILEFA